MRFYFYLTAITVGSLNPNMAIDSHDNLHVVWQDNTDYDSSGTDYDIFYKVAINLDAIPQTVTDLFFTSSICFIYS